jgi:16S rRNA (adenine1518-N6/adenine1519-N6)-dimethyltransferase
MRLVEHPEGFERMVLMLQREVVERLVAKSSTKDFGRITLLVQPFYDIKKEFTLPPDAFYPRPKVESTVVTLKRRDKPAVEKQLWVPYIRTIRSAFSQRRKTLKNALLRLTDPPLSPERIEEILKAAGIDPKRRGESLDLEEFRRISIELERRGI